MSVKIILVRHGETQLNAEKKFRGQTDVELNETGLEQAKKLAMALKKYKIDSVYTSPLIRARQTAEKIAKEHGLEIDIENNLKDISYGEWEGKSLDEVEREFPDIYKQWVSKPHTITFPGGDSLSTISRQIEQFLEKTLKEHNKTTIVAVSHRAVNKIILSKILGHIGSWFFRIRQGVACYNIFEYDSDSTVIHLLNSNSHLDSQ